MSIYQCIVDGGGKPEDVQNDDSMSYDHDEQGKTPQHCRREHEVGKLLNRNFKLYSESSIFVNVQQKVIRETDWNFFPLSVSKTQSYFCND